MRFCQKESRMRNRNAKRKSRPEKINVLATPVSISKHSSTQQSVDDELSSSMQASIVSQSPQAPFHPPYRKTLKHPGWWITAAAKVMGSSPVRTTRNDPLTQIQNERIDQNWSPRADTGHFTISRVSPLPLDHTVKVDSMRGHRN